MVQPGDLAIAPAVIELLDCAPVGIFVAAHDGSCVLVNRRWSEITGISYEDARRDGWENALHPDDAERVREAWYRSAQSGAPFQAEYRMCRPDGRSTWVSGKAHKTLDGYIGILNEIDDIVAARSKLLESERMFRGLAEASPAVIFKTDAEGQVVYVGPTWTEMTGLSADSALGVGWAEVILEDDRERVLEEWRAGAATMAAFRTEYRIVGADGRIRWVEGSARPVVDDDGTHSAHVGTLLDITHTKEVEGELRDQSYALEAAMEELQDQQKRLAAANRELRRQADHDLLTDLPNRGVFEAQVRKAVEAARHGSHPMAVLFIDLDGFKAVNDSKGHAAGDAVLLEIAHRIRATIRASDAVFRLGGDEFTVLTPRVEQEEHAAVVAKNLIQAIERPIAHGGGELHVSASVGIAVFPGDAEEAEGLIRCADRAMYRIKHDGGRGFRFFAHTTDEKAQSLIELRADLVGAVEREEFVLHYQPQIDLRTMQVVGAEALIRWNHPNLGLLAPNAFIEAAEYTGRIVEIGE